MSFENQQLTSSEKDSSTTPEQHQPIQQSSSVPDLSLNPPQVPPQVAQLAGQDFLVNLPVPNPPNATAQTSSSPPRTLWMGDLDPWSDEESIINLWFSLGKRVLVKLIKAKKGTPAASLNTGHAGYCFIEFESYDDAKSALSLNGSQIPNTSRTFRLNWASGATLSSQILQSPEYSLFVGDLSPSTTEAHLLALFQTRYKSVKTVRVMTDPTTGTSRCFGFVRFSDEEERAAALNEMSGVWCAGRPLRVALATSRNAAQANNQMLSNLNMGNAPPPVNAYVGIPPPPVTTGSSSQYGTMGSGVNQYQQPPPQSSTASEAYMYQQQLPPPVQYYHPDQQHPASGIPPPQFAPGGIMPPAMLGPDASSNQGNRMGQSVPYSDPNNTTVFVGGLASSVPEQTLAELFQPFGNIFHVKIPHGKGCGFIKFEKREDAEAAIAAMQGFQIGGSRVRLSWGRQQNNQRYQMASLAVAGINQGINPALSAGLPMGSSGFEDISRLQDDLSALHVSGGYDQTQSQQQPFGVSVNPMYYLPNDRGFEYNGDASHRYQNQSVHDYQESEALSKKNTPETNGEQLSGTGTGDASSVEDAEESSKVHDLYRVALSRGNVD